MVTKPSGLTTLKPSGVVHPLGEPRSNVACRASRTSPVGGEDGAKRRPQATARRSRAPDPVEAYSAERELGGCPGRWTKFPSRSALSRRREPLTTRPGGGGTRGGFAAHTPADQISAPDLSIEKLVGSEGEQPTEDGDTCV